MKELKFNSQICTTKEQSQRLLEMGLKPETADISHQYIEAEWGWIISPCDWNYCTMSEELIPAWSLHRLMEIGNIENAGFFDIKNAYDTCISIISSHIKFGLLNKEYVNQ